MPVVRGAPLSVPMAKPPLSVFPGCPKKLAPPAGLGRGSETSWPRLGRPPRSPAETHRRSSHGATRSGPSSPQRVGWSRSSSPLGCGLGLAWLASGTKRITHWSPSLFFELVGFSGCFSAVATTKSALVGRCLPVVGAHGKCCPDSTQTIQADPQLSAGLSPSQPVTRI